MPFKHTKTRPFFKKIVFFTSASLAAAAVACLAPVEAEAEEEASTSGLCSPKEESLCLSLESAAAEEEG